MTFDLPQSLDLLRRTPAILTAMLGGIDDRWAHGRYGVGTFSPFDVVGHLIQADHTNWMTRLRVILEHGEAKPFPVFDRYAMYEADRGKSIDELLGTFAEVRGASVAELAALGLSAEQLDRRGTHPALGPATARQLIASWVVHDLGHVHQVAKAMAYQYRDAVGPWAAYLTILPAAAAT